MATNPTGLGGIQSVFSDDKMLLLEYNNADISAILGDVQPLFRDNKSQRIRIVFKCMYQRSKLKPSPMIWKPGFEPESFQTQIRFFVSYLTWCKYQERYKSYGSQSSIFSIAVRLQVRWSAQSLIQKALQAVKLTSCLHLVPRLMMSGDMPLLPLCSFMAWTGNTLL